MANRLYEINDIGLSNINAKLIYVTSANYESDWSSILHSHPFTELFYVIKGKGMFHVEKEIYDVKADDLVIVNANVMHTESSKEKEPLEYIVLGIEGISLFSNENYSHSIHNYKDFKHEILFYMKTILKEAEAKSEYYNVISQHLLEILLIKVIRRTKTKLEIEDSKKHNHECAYIKNYIDIHYRENITLDILSDISYMNKYYLVHSFKKYSGMTPIHYLNNKRLTEAASMLKNTDYSVSQVTSIIGMSSQSYFSQSFKKKYKMSPMDYRKSFAYTKKP